MRVPTGINLPTNWKARVTTKYNITIPRIEAEYYGYDVGDELDVTITHLITSGHVKAKLRVNKTRLLQLPRSFVNKYDIRPGDYVAVFVEGAFIPFIDFRRR